MILLSGLSASAAEFTVTPPHWLYPGDNPEQLPDLGDTSTNANPTEELSQLPRPTYARIRALVGEEGRLLSRQIRSELPWLEEPARRLFMDTRHPAPARRDGKPVPAEVEYFLVYNPGTGPARTAPRLIQPVTVQLPQQGRDAGHRFVECRFTIDAEGRATDLAPVTAGELDGELLTAARATLPLWRFTPARGDGRPGSVVAPVLFLVEPPLQPGSTDAPPQVVFQEPPVFPAAARQAGVPGSVEIYGTIDVEGRTRDLVAVRSTHPIFERAALAAIRQWRFRPARQAGEPVACTFSQTFTFALSDGDPPSFLIVRADREKMKHLPPALQWDEPPEYAALRCGVYPFDALAEGREGSVQLIFVVGPDGRVLEDQVIGSADPAFAAAARAMIEAFRFKPAAKAGKPSPALLSLKVDYTKHGTILVPHERTTMKVVERLQHDRTSFARATELDQPLRTLTVPETAFPASVKDANTGEAVVEFVVDRDGEVQAPRVISASAPAFGFAAAQAVINLRYAPPSRQGKPVDVIVRQPVQFRRA